MTAVQEAAIAAGDGATEHAQALSAYIDKLSALQKHEMFQTILFSVNFCRIRKVYNKDFVNMEISTVHGSDAEAVWKVMQDFLIGQCDARRLEGIAPKSNLECSKSLAFGEPRTSKGSEESERQAIHCFAAAR